MILKNKNIIFKIRRSKVTDYAALMYVFVSNSTFSFSPKWYLTFLGNAVCDFDFT